MSQNERRQLEGHEMLCMTVDTFNEIAAALGQAPYVVAQPTFEIVNKKVRPLETYLQQLKDEAEKEGKQ